jgi:GMP synthase-like glutamine amidotransferase
LCTARPPHQSRHYSRIKGEKTERTQERLKSIFGKKLLVLKGPEYNRGRFLEVEAVNGEDILVAIIDNSLDPSVYRPVDHWRTFLDVPWEAFRAVESCFPDLERGYSHLILTGSEASILDGEGWVEGEVEIVREALEKRIPILGSCYGHQVLALALRGPAHVRRCAHPEVGWLPVRIEKESSLLGPRGEAYSFTIHFDEVIGLDDDFIVLASAPACPIQAFALRSGPAWGIQFHPEINIPAARELLRNLVRLKLETCSLFERALKTRPRDSGLIRRIVRGFLEARAEP